MLNLWLYSECIYGLFPQDIQDTQFICSGLLASRYSLWVFPNLKHYLNLWNLRCIKSVKIEAKQFYTSIVEEMIFRPSNGVPQKLRIQWHNCLTVNMKTYSWDFKILCVFQMIWIITEDTRSIRQHFHYFLYLWF